MRPRSRRDRLLYAWSQRGWPWRYALAVAVVGLAWASRERLLPDAADRSPFLAFGLAVLVTALAAGFGPGLLALLLSSLIALLFYLPPYLALAVHSSVDIGLLAAFLLEGLVAAMAGEIVRRAVASDQALRGSQARFLAFVARAERLRSAGGDPRQPVIEPLTERELEVLRLLALGLHNGEIAAAMFVSPNTVKTHLQHAYDKLSVRTRTEAVARCIELELLAPTAEHGPPGTRTD